MKRLLLILVLMALVMGVMVVPAAAARPIDVGGTWFYVPDDFDPEPTKVAGQNVFISNGDVGTWANPTPVGLEGISIEAFVVVAHKKHGTYQGRMDFTGEVDGKAGTLVIKANGSGPWPPGPGSGDWSGSWVILSGTGDLSNLRGQGSWWGPLGFLNYDGKVHFTG
ncbi:MAG: DUF3224 domain-containing protein [Acidimicrobiia bacterium]|nr:DUF3224 domain-containing protein [Acidimicrobiia bacterium]MDH3470434.1 DUF3224 domain-containing protein [Acidimicrobiia bacterium]